jgi:hypothetical protein
MRRLAALLLALLLPNVSFAIPVTVDYTDMWWNPNESGWGANVVQQGDTIFVIVFVYDRNRNATWFIAPEAIYQGGLFTGQLYQTTGPIYFQQPFDPASVTVTPVGQLTFNASSATAATLTYSTGGIVITKSITRQSWRTDNIAGFYIGGRQGVWSGCGPSLDGKIDSAATIGITEQSSGQVQIRDAGKSYTCNYSGTHSQVGHLGAITGNGVCDDSVSRFFAASEIQVSQIMLSMRYRLEQVGTTCVFEGYLGGVREAQ